MKAKSIKGKTVEEIRTELEKSLKDGFTPTLALVFLGMSQERKSITDILTNENIDVFGSTAAGEFIDGELGWETISILLLDMDRSHYKILFEKTGIRTDEQCAGSIGKLGVDLFSNPAFIVCASNNLSDGEMIIRGLENITGTGVPIYGGMAGMQVGVWNKSVVFTAGQETEYGIISLVIDQDKYEFEGLASCGWKAVGTVKTVTSSDGGWVHSIDNEPALDILVKFMGIDDHEIIDQKLDPLPNIGSNFPMELQKENGSSVMRTPMRGNWETRSFMCGGNVPEGSKMRFTLPADFDVIQEVIDESKSVKNSKLPEADALIIFSCFARFIAFGPLLSEEIQGLKDVWDVPTAGFFTFGEFGKSKGNNQEFHNITCCWVALKEK